MTWVLTRDQLPPDETPVLIQHRGTLMIGELRWEHPSHEETFEAFRYWDDPNHDGQGWDWDDVTHWMWLPPVNQPFGGEAELRRLLALSYSGHLLYGDDGELQDNTAFPCIDFKRDDPLVIAAKMAERAAKVAQADPRDLIEKQARNLIAGAELFGLEVRISTRPCEPLAMGNHEPVIEVSLLNRIYRKTI